MPSAPPGETSPLRKCNVHLFRYKNINVAPRKLFSGDYRGTANQHRAGALWIFLGGGGWVVAFDIGFILVDGVGGGADATPLYT